MFSKQAVEQLSKRIDNHDRRFDTIEYNLRDHSTESRAALRDLSDQTRGEFAALRKETDDRHAENRRRMWAIAITVIGALTTVAATSYIASHGLSAPIVSGTTDVEMAKTLKHLDNTLMQLDNHRGPP